jgi:predicted Fe-Mo cluster-binding NifX family protein
MKIAITSTGNTSDSRLDPRFGRCSYFVIYDTDTREMEFLPNSARDAKEGAGPASVQIVASRNVKKIISGEFGARVRSLLDSLGIEMITVRDPEKSISDIVNMPDQQ